MLSLAYTALPDLVYYRDCVLVLVGRRDIKYTFSFFWQASDSRDHLLLRPLRFVCVVIKLQVHTSHGSNDVNVAMSHSRQSQKRGDHMFY